MRKWTKLLSTFVFTVFGASAVIILLCSAIPDIPTTRLAAFPLCVLALSTLISAIDGKMRAFISITLSSICLVIGIRLGSIQGFLMGAFCGTLALYFPLAATNNSVVAPLIALLSHIAAPLIRRLCALPSSPYLFPCSCIYLFLYLLYVNRSNIVHQCGANQRPARQMRIGNTLFVAILFLLILGGSRLPIIRDSVMMVLQTIVGAIAWFFSLFSSPPVPAGTSMGSESGIFGALPAEEPALFWIILDRIATVAVVIGGIILLLWLLKQTPRFLYRIYQKIVAMLTRFIHNASGAYTDVVEDIRPKGESKTVFTFKNPLKNLYSTRFARYLKVSDRQFIRNSYALILRRQKGGDMHSTARENLSAGAPCRKADPALFTESYERARYSDHPITQIDVENAKQIY